MKEKVEVDNPLDPKSPSPKSKSQDAAGAGIAFTIISSKPQLSHTSPSLSGWYHLKIVEEVWAAAGIAISFSYQSYQGALYPLAVSQSVKISSQLLPPSIENCK